MPTTKLTHEELVALDLLIAAARAQPTRVDAGPLAAGWAKAVVKVAKAATKYTPAVANLVTAFIGAETARVDPATRKSLEKLKGTVDQVSLEQLLELRRQVIADE